MKTIIIFVYDISLVGGAEKVALNIANELSKKSKVIVVSAFMTKDQPIVCLSNRISIEVLSTQKISMTLGMPILVKKLRTIIRKYQPYSLLSITAGMNTIVYLSSLGFDTKTVYAEHSNLQNNFYGKKHSFRQWIGANKLDYVITLTDSDKKMFEEKYELDDEKVKTIYNWVETAIDRNNYVPSNNIISVGRLVDVKGFDRVIEVSRILKNKIDFQWDIYGEGPERDKLQRLIDRHGLEKNITLKGYKSNIEEILPQYGLFVSTSTYEGFPLSFLEARGKGLPIVSFDCPTGPAEIIENNVDGILVPPYDVCSMANEILNLLNDFRKMKKLSIAISSNDDKFDKKNIIKKWKEVLLDEQSSYQI